jgi:PleD family two-component response regulator
VLSEAASKVGDGRLDIAVEISTGCEVGRLAEKFNGMVKKLAVLNHALQIAATVDKLTGALNRGKIEEILTAEMARARRHHHPLSMILLDLDHFKKVNDTYGHLVGDEVLKSVVTAIKGNIRISDALGRWGGEEFILLLPETKVRSNVEQCAPHEVGRVTISCGVAEMAEGDSDDSLIKRADDALYSAKRKGRNQVELGSRPDLGAKQLTLPASLGSPPISPANVFRTLGKGS